jgi:transposase InsO family protein
VTLGRSGIQTIRIYPGSPRENGCNERLSGTLPREMLNTEWFATTRRPEEMPDYIIKFCLKNSIVRSSARLAAASS